MTRHEAWAQRANDLALALGVDPAIAKKIYNLGLETAAESLAGAGGNNEYLYTGSPETGYMRQKALSKEIRDLKL